MKDMHTFARGSRVLPRTAAALLLPWLVCACATANAAGPVAANGAATPASGAASGTMRSGPDPGLVTPAPPTGDSRIAEPAPRNVDPSIVQTPPPDAQTPSGTQERNRPPGAGPGQSREDDCRGPAELCKQDSAR